MYLFYLFFIVCFQGDWLKENRAQRVKKWTVFMDEMCEESANVDAKYNEDMAAVTKHYQHIEEKLCIS